MTVSPGPISGHNPFVGREHEIVTLNAATADPSVRIISIYGDRGAGKTTIASQLFYHHRDIANVFDSTSYLSAHGTTEQVLLDQLYRTLSASPQRSYTPRELPALMEAEIEAHPDNRLIFVDNVETDVMLGDLFGKCVRMLGRTKNRCVLLLTSRDALPDAVIERSGRCDIRLGGIQETSAVLSILGDGLRYRHSPEELIRMANTIGRLPQRLLYCRWSQPSDIQAFVQRFAEQQQPLSMEALRLVMSRLSDPEPLLACGVLRGTDIDKRLLAVLVDRFGEHAGALFPDLLEELLSHRLLAPVAGRTSEVRIHPDTHVDLMRMCEERGKSWTRSCHQAASQYYRARCVDDPDDVSAVGDLVHHQLALGEFSDAYESVFGGNNVERWRQQASSIRIEPILEELRNTSRLNSIVTTQERRANISVALAHVSSDLGRPKLCLDHLTTALHYLDGLPRTDAVTQTLRQLWTQMAISHANLGDTARCIEYYRRAIASDELGIETQTALCMGYLGYEYCDFEDFAPAHYWTQRALDTCPRDRSWQVFSKNLSNRGLVLYYEGNLGGAATHLRHAVELVGERSSSAYDIREHGRAMSHYAMVILAQGYSPLEVSSLLENSLASTKQAGDARRIAVTEGRLGIVFSRIGDLDRAEALLRKAILSHHGVGDIRNMIFELLALLTIRHLRLYGNYAQTIADLERASPTVDADLIELIRSSVARPDKRYLVEFWLHRQHPRLFNSLTTQQ